MIYTPITCRSGTYYEVLRKRGVRFEFFHRIREITLDPQAERIERIFIDRQVDIHGSTYEPLVEVNGLPCWPSAPRYEQIVQGEDLQRGPAPGDRPYNLESSWSGWQPVSEVMGADGNPGLLCGEDFDYVVLGISVGALPGICGELMYANESFKSMVEGIETTQTQAAQIWLAKSTWEMGWEPRLDEQRTVADGFEDPMNSWADLTHLISREQWPAGAMPQSLIYLCGPATDEPPTADAGPEYQRQQYERVKKTSVDWLDKYTGTLWPNATVAGGDGLDWNLVVNAATADGITQQDSQYYRINIDPTERYVQTIAGTTRYRLQAGESGFDNLVLAGDWTDTGFNVGCVEAATMSGMQASRAISGYPRMVIGEGPRTGSGSGNANLLPAYVERLDDEEMAPPFSFKGMKIRSFPVEADIGKLQAYLDRFLNVAPPEIVEYRPFGNLVYIQVVTYESMESELNPEGFFSENELTFNVLVTRGKRVGGAWKAIDVALHLPFLFVDNPWAIATGREIYGYPKAHSWLDIPADPEHPDGLAVDTPVFERTGEHNKLERHRLLDVHKLDESFEQRVLHVVDGALHGANDLLLGKNGLLAEADLSMLKSVGQVFSDQQIAIDSLKQFRHIEDPSRACYQAIVRTMMRIDKYHGAGLIPGAYELRLHHYGGRTICEHLGLIPAKTETVDGKEVHILRPRLPLWMAFDCSYVDGQVLFEFDHR